MVVSLETLEYLKKGGRISGDAGRDREHPLGQADHRGRARPGRDGRQAADAVEVARALHRDPDRATDRAGRDPAHDRRSDMSDVDAFKAEMVAARRARPARTSPSRSSARPSGRISVRAASAPRCCTRADPRRASATGPSPGSRTTVDRHGCGDGCLRSGCEGCGTVAPRWTRRAADRSLYLPRYMTHRSLTTRTEPRGVVRETTHPLLTATHRAAPPPEVHLAR